MPSPEPWSPPGTPSQARGEGAAYQEQGGGAVGESEEAGHVPAGATAGGQVPGMLVLLVLQERAGPEGPQPCAHLHPPAFLLSGGL